MTLHILPDLDQGEAWRAIPGLEGYEVSDLGRVRSFRRHGGRVRSLVTTPRIKKTRLNTVGYLVVSLQVPGGQRCSSYHVHSLVASAFLGPRPEGMQVAHADGNRANGRLSNLRYATPLENANDKRIHGTDTPGERNGTHKLTDADVRAIRVLREQGALQRELAARFGVSRSTIQFVTSGKRWTHVKEAS